VAQGRANDILIVVCYNLVAYSEESGCAMRVPTEIMAYGRVKDR